jgi:hypothetical protein
MGTTRYLFQEKCWAVIVRLFVVLAARIHTSQGKEYHPMPAKSIQGRCLIALAFLLGRTSTRAVSWASLVPVAEDWLHNGFLSKHTTVHVSKGEDMRCSSIADVPRSSGALQKAGDRHSRVSDTVQAWNQQSCSCRLGHSAT